MATKQKFDWNKAKRRILTILKSDSAEDTRKKKIELFLKNLPFGMSLNDYEFSYDSCGYPYYATHKTYKTDSFKLRNILDEEFDPETNESDYHCPCCRKPI